jgi:DNA-binding MarR family transcriptional regulator
MGNKVTSANASRILQRAKRTLGRAAGHIRLLCEHLIDSPVDPLLLCQLLVSIGRDLSTRLNHVVGSAGIGYAEFQVLAGLFTRGVKGAYPTELARRLGESSANLTRITDRLIEKNLISRQRSKRDRRRVLIHLTEDGASTVRACLPVASAAISSFFDELTSAEQTKWIGNWVRIPQHRKSPFTKMPCP